MRFIFFILFLIFLGVPAHSQTIKTNLIYVVNKPAKITNKTPVLIILHGYGSNETDSKGMAKFLQDNFLVFSLRAPYPTNSVGYCWFKMEFLEWAQFKNNYKEAELSKAKILSFISNACRAYKADSSQVFVMGFSQGGMMAYDVAISSPKKIKGVLALSTRIMEETMQRQNIDWPNVQKVKFYLVGGYSDKVISYLDSYKAHDLLKTKGIWDLTVKFYDIPHTITQPEINEFKNWLSSRSGFPQK